MQHKHAFPVSTAGVALVELAIALPILIMALVGLIEYGRYAYFVIEVGNAAHAGAQYGAQDASSGANVTGMKNAAIQDGQNSIFPLTASAVSARNVCACWTGTTEVPSPPTAAQCGPPPPPCAAGRQVTYAQVTVTGTISPLFNYSRLGLPSSWTATRTATIRILTQ